MFCTKCAAENPAEAEFCYKCGRPLFAPQPELANQTAKIAGTKPAAAISNTPKPAPRYEWATIYGWVFALAALYLWIVGLKTFSQGKELTPAGLPFGSAKSSGVGSALVQALLFGATGFTIIRRKKIAVTLVWASLAVSGIGVIVRGFIPVDILLCMGSLGFAIWYTEKASPLLVEPHQAQPSSGSLARPTSSWVDGNSVGLIVVLVAAVLFLFSSLTKWRDRVLPSRAASEPPVDQLHRRNAEPRVAPEESQPLVQRADMELLTPNKLIARCGEPLTDTTRMFTESKIKGLIRRDISYKGGNGSVVMLMFWSDADVTNDRKWNFLSMFEGGAEYRADDSDHILSVLPCAGE